MTAGPKLPDGWDQDKLVTCVRRTERGKAKMPEMLMKLGIAKDLSVGLKLSHSKGTALANSLKGADGERLLVTAARIIDLPIPG